MYKWPKNKNCVTPKMVLQSNYTAYKELVKTQLMGKANQQTSMPRWHRCKMIQQVRLNTLEMNGELESLRKTEK